MFMTTPISLIELKNNLPQLSWPQVIPALRQDEIVWKMIQKPEFRELAITKLGNNPHSWTPAHLALLAMGIDLEPDALRNESLGEINPELRVKVVATYEAHMVNEPPEMTLDSAGLLALALLEHHHQTNSWENIPQTNHWKTAYACLLGFIEQPIKLLNGLLTPNLIHAVLANPFSSEDQKNLLVSVASSMTTENRLSLLRSLGCQRPVLAAKVARKIWKGDPNPEFFTQVNSSYLSNLFPVFEIIHSTKKSLAADLALAEAQLVSGNGQKGESSLELAWQKSIQLQNILASQLCLVTAQLGDSDKSHEYWKNVQNIPAIPTENKAELAISWLEKGNIKAAQRLLENIEESANPAVQLAFARVYILQANYASAKEAALLAATDAEKLNFEMQVLLTKCLLEIGLAYQANQVIEIAQKSQPNRKDIIHLSAKAHAAIGAFPQAVHAMHLALAFEPDHIDTYRDFALMHELAGLWPAANEAREYILTVQNDPIPADYHALAKCALKLDRPQDALEICQTLLEKNPEDGLAHALLGEALAEIGDHDQAQEHLQNAVQYAPDQAFPWLALSQYFNNAGESDEVSETLRKAVQIAPDQAELHLALGQDYLSAGSQSQALTSLRRADQLTSTIFTTETYHLRSRIAFPFAKTLFELGHAEQALRTIQEAFPLPENQLETLHLQAQIFTFLNRPQQAIPLLAKAILLDPSNANIIIDYASAQLQANQDLEKAISALQNLLENDPQNIEALAWLAEIMRANGDPNNALKTYRKALSTPLSEDPYWLPRLSIGLAQSAIDLDQPETALAVLNKDWQTTPHNHLVISQTLAKAFQKAHLFDKALQAAKSAREMEPTSLDNLIWFADLAEEVQAYDESIDALNYALEIEPDHADLRLNISRIYRKIGDINQAYQTIRKIAEIDQSTNQELRLAAQQLMELDYPEDAIVCLKIAVQRCIEAADYAQCSKSIFELIDIYLQVNRQADALQAVDEILNQQTEKDPALLGKRVVLLNQVNGSDEAYAAIEQAFSQYPDSTSLNLAASRIHHENGNLQKSLNHANMAVEKNTDINLDETRYTAFTFAADISDACLLSKDANRILQQVEELPGSSEDLSYLCLRAEIALELGEEIDAAKVLTSALDIAPEHPRVMALQARLTARHGDLYNADLTLKNALSAWGSKQQHQAITPAEILGISEAAVELHEWDSAIYLLRDAVAQFPQEPRSHLRLARGLVLRAEHQRLCETLRVIQHAPGVHATADPAYQQFEERILAAVQSSDGLNSQTNQSTIIQWRARGQAIFQPIQEHAKALGEIPHTPESFGAYLAALRYSSDNQQSDIDAQSISPQELEQESNSSINLIFEIALALSAQHPESAKSAARSALNTSTRQRYPSQPLCYAVQAILAEQTGEFSEALTIIEHALSIWTDEPRWHLWAAELMQSQEAPDLDPILKHLSRATELEPKYGLHHLKLGQAYLQNKSPDLAIPVLEEATHLLPNEAKSWLSLARAYQATGEIAQIFHNAERAAELDPSNIECYLLLAESALMINDAEKAFNYCQAALEVDDTDPKVLLLKARSLDQIGKHQDALKTFERALQNSPTSAHLMLEHAQIIRRASGIDAQIEALKELVDEFPENPQLLSELSDALVENNQTDSAIMAAQKALQTSHGNLDSTEQVHLHTMLGRLMRRTGQLDQAIHNLSKAIQYSPEAVDAYLELGRVYQDRRQYSIALDAFQQAIAIDPANPQAYYLAGQALKSAKDYSAAEEMLQNAAKLAPDDLAIRRQLGGLVALNLVHNRKNISEIYAE
jgi:tetratricopeptide (TPR) repeat protein